MLSYFTLKSAFYPLFHNYPKLNIDMYRKKCYNHNRTKYVFIGGINVISSTAFHNY